MATRKKKDGKDPVRKLDSPRYAAMFRKTRGRADRALAAYGEPTISLDELRRRLATSVKVESLGDWIVEDRKSGW